jgi:hypothetical protein
VKTDHVDPTGKLLEALAALRGDVREDQKLDLGEDGGADPLGFALGLKDLT